MNHLSDHVKKYFRYFFYFLLAANLLVINKMNGHGEMLLHPVHSSRGILDLELNFGQAKQDSILKTWDSTKRGSIVLGTKCSETYEALIATKVAKDLNNWDLLFIVFYSLLLIVFTLRLYPFKGFAPKLSLVITCILAAALFDYIENFFIAYALTHHSSGSPFLAPPAWHIWVPSLIKWILVIMVVGYLLIQLIAQGLMKSALQSLSEYLTGTLKLIWDFRIAFFGLLILFFALWSMDQGRDLLLIINSSRRGPATFLPAVTILALLNWYLPKLYTPTPAPGISLKNYFFGFWKVPSDHHAMGKHRIDGARLMGSLTFLIPMICILHAMRIFGIPYWLQWINPFLLLIVILTFYQLGQYNAWINDMFAPGGIVNKKRFFIFSGTALLIIFLFIPIGDNVKPFFLGFLAFDLFLLSLVFLVFTTIRTCNWGKINLPVNNMTPYVFIPGMVLLLIFLVGNLSPRLFFFGDRFRLLTLPVILCAVCFYGIVFSYILFIDRVYRIQLISFVFIVGIIVSALSDNPYHRIKKIPTENHFETADSLPAYIRAWLLKRRPEIDSFYLATRDSFPVFVVNAYGGGIRAAAWTTMVISRLDELFRENNIRDFQHYALSYSGASGGTIGLSELCAARYSLDTTPSPDQWAKLYKNDFLTPLIVGLLGRDAWNSSFGLHIGDDRSVLQDHIWEKRLANIGINYDSPFVRYWDAAGRKGKYEVPLLFANTYLVDSGLKAITAPVRLSHKNFPGTVFIEDLLEKDYTAGIKLSTGAFLSARFPMISPSGKIDKAHHFMDGGLKENSGAETSKEILAVLNRILRRMGDTDSVYKKVRVILLSIPNTVKGTDSLQTAPNFFELTATLTALANNWVGNTNKADTINARDTSGWIRYQYYQFRPSAQCVDEFKPVLPLGWQISGYALDQMKKSLGNTDPGLDSILGLVRRPTQKNGFVIK